MAEFTESLRTQCLEWVKNQFEGVYVNQHGAIIVPFDKTVVFVEVTDAFTDKGRVNVRAPVLLDLGLTPEVTRHVAVNGGNFLFGALSFYAEGGAETATLEFDYSLFGETVNEPVLAAAVWLAVGSATKIQDDLRPRFGGRSILD
ncbi:MAG: T3SS (YopN, CesT) and YbjN peptide-binding chaperone 1 [Actinoallomurus sp.]